MTSYNVNSGSTAQQRDPCNTKWCPPPQIKVIGDTTKFWPKESIPYAGIDIRKYGSKINSIYKTILKLKETNTSPKSI